jgi:membrane-bound lytic murein transglycosylase B
MKKIAILTALSAITLSSFAFAEEKPTTKPVSETEKAVAAKPVVKKDAKTTAKKAMNNAPKGTGSRAMAQFKKMDKDSDGKVSKTEFTDFQMTIFTKKDRNKDGNLLPAELSPTLAKAAQAAKN